MADKDPLPEGAGDKTWEMTESANTEPNEPTQTADPSEDLDPIGDPSACDPSAGLKFHTHIRGDQYWQINRGRDIRYAVFNAPLLVISVAPSESDLPPCFEVKVESMTPDFCQIGGILNGSVMPFVNDTELLERAVYLLQAGTCSVRSTIVDGNGDETIEEVSFEYVGVVPSGRCPVIPE